MQSRVYADVIGRLSLLSQSRGIPLNPERAARIGEHPLDESSQRELRLIIAEICDAVSVPVIVSGGCGCAQDAAAAANAGAGAVAVASVLHYKKTSVPELKNGIRALGVEVRR